MKTFEKIVGLIALLGLTMKFCFIPFGSLIFILSLLGLASVYCYLGILLFNNVRFRDLSSIDPLENTPKLRKIESAVLGGILALLCLGLLFKFQSWHGSAMFLYTGLAGLIIIVLIGIVRYFKTKDQYYHKIFLRVIIIGAISIMMVFISDENYLKIQYRNYPDYIVARRNYFNNPDNVELQKRFQKELDRIYMSKEAFKAIYYEEKK